MTQEPSNEDRLPADVQRWPTDPATLLGVPSEATRRDVKRAYTRLIKQYKPEHAPEEFRRLRTAFEELDRQLEWREIYQLRYSQTSDDEADVPTGPVIEDHIDARAIHIVDEVTHRRSDSDQPPTLRDSQSASRRTKSHDDAPATPDQLWQQALDGGDLKAVYNGLLHWTRQRIPSEIDYARLYWLLTLVSDLDANRDPCTWLIEGLQKHGTSGRLLEMLEVEVRRRDGQVPQLCDAAVLDERFSARMLVSIADLRWYAARRQNRIDLIIHDFEFLKRRLLDEASEWLRLLSIALRHVALTHTVAFINQIREELSHLTSASSQDWIWDSIETELLLHNAWKAATDQCRQRPKTMPSILIEIIQLIETTWEANVVETRTPILNFCWLLIDDPSLRLSELSQLGEARLLLVRLRTLLDQQLAMKGLHRISELTPGLDEELQRFIRKYFVQSEASDFNTLVLNFCLREAVTPHDIVAALDRMTVTVPEQYFATAEQITTNLALHCVVQAHRLLW